MKTAVTDFLSNHKPNMPVKSQTAERQKRTLNYQNTEPSSVSRLWSAGALTSDQVFVIYQDVESVLWTLLVLFDGGEHRQNQTGEHQEEPAHTTLHIKQSAAASGFSSWKLISGLRSVWGTIYWMCR